MKALLLIDLQTDFCPLGALAVNEGAHTIPVANQLIDHFELVVATQDWHPADHKSFAANHPWRRPGQIIDLNGLQQILWPIHCVQNSFGAGLHPDLQDQKITKIFYKGTDKEIDSYSGFFDNGHQKTTGLHDYLQEMKVTELFIMGLATDYCVKFSVLDALILGYQTFVVVDGCRGVNLEKGDSEKALQEMQNKGATLLSAEELINRLQKDSVES